MSNEAALGGLLPQASTSPASEYDPNPSLGGTSFPLEPFAESDMVFPEVQIQNVVVLAIVFLVGLLVNLMALPVILFRRTKFGNGLFAVLILCLTVSDTAVIFFSVLGGLIVEASNLLWGGTVGSCKIYHWLSAWITGLSAYLLVAIVGMVMMKTTRSCLGRLRDCRWLLLTLLVVSGLYALPELFVRTTVDLGVDLGGASQDVCILGAGGVEYGLYVAFRLTMRHVIPAILVITTIVRPETKLSKRVSHLFFGHLSTPCQCGKNGRNLSMPHECPAMQTAMLKNSAATSTTNSSPSGTATKPNGHIITIPPANTKPDLLMDSEQQLVVNSVDGSQNRVGFIRRRGRDGGKRFAIQPEDPHRRKYKLVLAVYFLFCTILNFVLDLAFQIQSSESTEEMVWATSSSVSPLTLDYTNHSENLATAIFALAHLQQIGDPIIFVLAEFVFK